MAASKKAWVNYFPKIPTLPDIFSLRKWKKAPKNKKQTNKHKQKKNKNKKKYV